MTKESSTHKVEVGIVDELFGFWSKIAITLVGPPEPSVLLYAMLYTVKPFGGNLSTLCRFSMPHMLAKLKI